MKKHPLLFVLFAFCFSANAQRSYSMLTKNALEAMWKAKDSTDYLKVLNLYEEAFKRYPDSIDELGLYKSSVIAAELKKYDKAFRYLFSLSKIEAYKGNTPGWEYVVGNYAESEYKNLIEDPRWIELRRKSFLAKAKFYRKLHISQVEFFKTKPKPITEDLETSKLYNKLRTQNLFLLKKQQDYSISFAVNDSTQTSFFVHLPKSYNPSKEYSLLVFLHGAVKSNALTDYQTAYGNLDGWNRFYTKYAAKDDVILVFPKGSRIYNWMAPDNGFFMVPEIVRQIKTTINIDDNKVFISGHSNGATGSFSYLVKEPTQFAGFYGFNTYPKVFTGGTFINNVKNRSFINFSTDLDYYYPPNANDSMDSLMKSLNANYSDYRYKGFPHWFPEFAQSETAFRILFSDLKNRKRNPFPKKISWEFDNNSYGNVDWLLDVKLDTLSKKANWQNELNFKINSWLSYNKEDSLISTKTDKKAFSFPRTSGKIMASFKSNTFWIEVSRIKSFKIGISPEMIDLSKTIKVYVNHKLRYDGKVVFNRKFMLKSFSKNQDRKQLWVNYIEIKV